MKEITRVEEVDGKTRVYMTETTRDICKACLTSGQIEGQPCKACDGTGFVSQTRDYSVTLPDGCTVEYYAQCLGMQYLAQCGDPKTLREMYSGSDDGSEDACIRRAR